VPQYIYGTTKSFVDVREWNLAEGDMFTDHDVRNASKVCVIGQRLVAELFPDESPLGKEVRIHNVPFKIIGVLAEKGANMMGTDQDDIVLAPWTTIKFRVVGSSLGSVNQSAGESVKGSANSLNNIYPNTETNFYSEQSATQKANNPFPVKFSSIDQILTAVHSAEEIPVAIEQITRLLRERHRIRPGEPDDFRIRDMAEMTKALSSTVMMTTQLLLAVALISLLVGGVGIMNIMLVSVTERTREIGLRMAVGARGGDVLKQFLVEAVLLCFFGGVVGILVGQAISYLVSTFLQWPTELSVSAILAAFIVSASVGITFGYYPAWKASRLDPITALRYE
jgi:ABC-type antimicrobial peptide transport system permease subunit